MTTRDPVDSVRETPSNGPQIDRVWMYAMVNLGFIGSVVIFIMILLAVYRTYKMKQAGRGHNVYTALNFSIWILNLLACLEWALLRTNTFFEHTTEEKCLAIYMSNFLCYKIAKYLLHVLLLYRLHLAFKNTMLKLNKNWMLLFIAIITISFIAFTSLWIRTCIRRVSVGSAVEDASLKICTLYNSDSSAELSFFDKIWPVLFGAQDFLVSAATLAIFIKKLKDLLSDHESNDIETEQLVRKLIVCSSVAMVSTFIFYTLAIPFWPNLTFLLPFDAMVNSLCVILLLDYAYAAYAKLFCCCDGCLKHVLQHSKHTSVENPQRMSMVIVNAYAHNRDELDELSKNGNEGAETQL